MREKYICCFGETLWGESTAGNLSGGEPLNIAVGLQSLGVPAVLISCVGEDEMGQRIKDYLQTKSCTTRAIQTDLRYGTGIVRRRIAPSGEKYNEFVQPAAWDHIKYSTPLANLVKNAYALVFSTLSCRNKNNLETLIQLMPDAPLKVYDVNLMPRYYDQNLVELLLKRADIAKINDADLSIIAAWYQIGSFSENEQLQILSKKFELKKLILTKGISGVTCLEEGVFYYAKNYHVQPQDFSAASAIFLAGFLTNLYLKQPTGKALQYACALGALTTPYTAQRQFSPTS